ncbi:MAG: hypothetical protein EOP08_17575 [Proteobacteria bacterium]|nr:MAG: hypothetical protein EOP08_17575 [Pseudomonadota bacterium]
MARIAEFRFDETTWKGARDMQRAEWKLLLEELIDDGDFDEALAGRYLLATATAGAVLFEALDEEGVVVQAVRLELSALAEPIREYASIIRRLHVSEESYNTASFRALDMAKKVVHDRAADILSRAIGTISTEPATLRRIFSIVFSLRVDTSKLPWAHRHGFR